MEQKTMKQTQKDRILQYMKDFGSITRLQAFTDLGVQELPQRIHELRKEYVIGDEIVNAKNRYGEPVQFKRYFLGEAKQ